MEKLQVLRKYIRSLGSLAVAFSSGVDSTFLLKVAHEELGDKAIAVTAVSCIFPKREGDEASSFCKSNGIRQFILEFDELSIPEFSRNPVNRCYLCKKELFTRIISLAGENGVEHVCEGSNMDDMGDYRPGLKAVAELGVKSPLRECGLYREEIRSLSRQMGLPTWKKQSFACLASRFVYGEEINLQKLGMVEKVENLLLDMGFLQLRVRIHGENLARIEVLPQEFERLLSMREEITGKLREAGFAYVTMDLKGYRTGSMNEVIKLDRKGNNDYNLL